LEQLIDTGAVSRDHVKIVWNATGDGRTRDSHFAMNGQEVKFGEAFTSPTGARMCTLGTYPLAQVGPT